MGLDELSENEKRLFEYIKERDFEAEKWSTPKAASDLKMDEKEIYEGLCNLQKELKGRFYIYYRNGGLRIQAK
jgi:hypothetical protein